MDRFSVMPAQAGIQTSLEILWIPAPRLRGDRLHSAGMTARGSTDSQ